MEAKLINAVLNIQRVARGFITRKRFEKILEEMYLKVSFYLYIFKTIINIQNISGNTTNNRKNE